MSKFMALKEELRVRLEAPDWQEFLPVLESMGGRETAGPLLSFLPHGGELQARASVALGVTVAALAAEMPESARVIMRRMIWSMNEESGNIGWGIPQAMAEILARSRLLAGEFHQVLISYIMDTGADDNYVEHVPLLRACFWAVGRLAADRPDLAASAAPWLLDGLESEDAEVRGQAAMALARLWEGGQEKAREASALLKPLAGDGERYFDFFDGAIQRRISVAAALGRAERAFNAS